MQGRSLQQWLDEYDSSHRHPVNKAIHWVCVPAIMLSLLALLWLVRIPLPWSIPWLLNTAVCFLLPVMIYYLLLSPRLAAGMLLVFGVLLYLITALERLQTPLWRIALVIFVVAWIGQFIGHHIEGKRPSFFKDLQFLLIGPLWLLAALYRRFNLAC